MSLYAVELKVTGTFSAYTLRSGVREQHDTVAELIEWLKLQPQDGNVTLTFFVPSQYANELMELFQRIQKEADQ